MTGLDKALVSSGRWCTLGAAIAVVGVCLALSTCALPSAQAQPAQIVGVASVIDGDTIEIHQTRIRLNGVDAPEHGARCGNVNVYQRASLALSDMIGSRTVHCAANGTDRYGRQVAQCSARGVDLAGAMVSAGWSRDWPRYSHGAYADEEAQARAAHRGLWALQCPSNLWGDRNYN